MAAGHEREPGQAGDGNAAVLRAGAERAVGVLIAGQVSQPRLDGVLGGLIEHPLGQVGIGGVVLNMLGFDRRLCQVVAGRTIRGQTEEAAGQAEEAAGPQNHPLP